MNAPVIKTPLLERILTPEREGRKAAQSTGVGFAVPSLGERPVDPDMAPIWVSDMRGQVVSTKRSEKTGCGRYGFFRIGFEDEDAWLSHTITSLASRGAIQEAPFQEALNLMEKGGIPAHHLVIPYDQVRAFTGEDASPEDADNVMS